MANLINTELEGRDVWDPEKGSEGETVGSSEGRKKEGKLWLGGTTQSIYDHTHTQRK